MIDPIVTLSSKYTMEDNPLKFKDLMSASPADRYTVYAKMARYNGRTRSSGDTVLQRYDRVVQAYHSIEYEGISLRGIYYRVVSLFGEAKTETTYVNYQKVVSDMRDYGILPFELVLDGTRTFYDHEGFSSKEAFIESVSKSYKVHRWSDKAAKPLLIVEKLAMIDILRPICKRWGIVMLAARGFNSKTGWYNVMGYVEEGQRLDILLLTDYDTSGLEMINPGREAILRHDMLGKVNIKRIGLNQEHIDRYNLITREDKSDRSLKACELDAMTPQEAREMVSEYLNEYMPESEIKSLEEQEDREREGFRLLEW